MLAFFSAATVTAITMTTSTQSTSVGGNASQNAQAIAEAGINQAEAKINYGNVNGANPSAANLLGCAGATGAADTNGPSNCATPSPLTYCITAAAGCANAAAGSASVYGYFSGVNSGSYNGTTVPASTWYILSTGYVANPTGPGTIGRSVTALVKIAPLGAGAVGALWNHIFLTSPRVDGVCQTAFNGNNVNIDAPIYSIGNFCLLGNNETIIESGQPIDLMIGGRLVFGGNSADTVGQDATHKITSGVVVGDCSATIAGATTPCATGGWNYFVTTLDTFISQDAPSLTNTQMETDYATFDPGPKHTCLAGTNPAPLADNQFDFSIAAGEGTSVVPDNTGSGANGGVFDLTPAASYACISKNGTNAGYLIWNNGGSSLTVSGITVPSKTLAVNGSIFFDSNLQVSQAMTYTGLGVVEAAGTITLNQNVCGTSPCNTASTAWQGSSGNNSMLTLVSLIANSATAINIAGNSQTYQGSLWCQPSSTMIINGNSAVLNGPMSVGKINFLGNTPHLLPLPVIKNMPTGAPVPPNTAVTISPPVFLK